MRDIRVLQGPKLCCEDVWFPDMEKLVKEEVSTCIACHATGQQHPPEPLQLTPLPDGP